MSSFSHSWIGIFGALVCCFACMPSNKSGTTTVTIYAASSLTNVWEELAAAYEAQNPDVRVRLNFAGSSTLAMQIVEGAPADIFVSANSLQMDAVISNGITNQPSHVFATNELVVITHVESKVQTLDDLVNASVVFASPNVPIRVYTDQVLNNIGSEYAQLVKRQVVSEETNVRQVVLRVSLGEADAAFVYATDITADIQDSVRVIPIPNTVNVQAEYLIIALNEQIIIQDILDFLQSSQAHAILMEWGFSRP